MKDIIDEMRRKEFDNIKEDLCSTYEGTVFLETYLGGRRHKSNKVGLPV